MLTVSELYIYPIKSLAGIAVDTSIVTSRGLQHDRRLMLVDENNCFFTQREYPEMALLQPFIKNEGLYIHHKQNTVSPLFIPHQSTTNETAVVKIWNDTCEAQLFETFINQWFSQVLGLACRLVFMQDNTIRYADKRYALNNEMTSFADDYPMLMIGNATLDDLNARLPEPVPMNRFRPNIVFNGGKPFLEDKMQEFTINGIDFNGVKPCARCIIPTINQDDSSKSKEPLKTLATYRLKENKILFGQNLVHSGDGIISIGDAINIKKYQPSPI
ncbi:MAG: MOSC N-terminal beta barrel domain-containing protein [Chitinophagaceae bacterium]